MSHSKSWKRPAFIVGLIVLIFAVCGVSVRAAYNKEVLQAVKNGVPNTADNRVVLAELFSAGT